MICVSLSDLKTFLWSPDFNNRNVEESSCPAERLGMLPFGGSAASPGSETKLASGARHGVAEENDVPKGRHLIPGKTRRYSAILSDQYGM